MDDRQQLAPPGASRSAADKTPHGNCVEHGLGRRSNDIGRFGTEGFNFQGLDRDNYNVPAPDASKEDRVNFFLDGVKSFGARDQTAIALCNDPRRCSRPTRQGCRAGAVASRTVGSC